MNKRELFILFWKFYFKSCQLKDGEYKFLCVLRKEIKNGREIYER